MHNTIWKYQQIGRPVGLSVYRSVCLSVSLPVWQDTPWNSGGQRQRKCPLSTMQIPPFRQGLVIHRFTRRSRTYRTTQGSEQRTTGKRSRVNISTRRSRYRMYFCTHSCIDTRTPSKKQGAQLTDIKITVIMHHAGTTTPPDELCVEMLS